MRIDKRTCGDRQTERYDIAISRVSYLYKYFLTDRGFYGNVFWENMTIFSPFLGCRRIVFLTIKYLSTLYKIRNPLNSKLSLNFI